jgi:hypothetical protein
MVGNRGSYHNNNDNKSSSFYNQRRNAATSNEIKEHSRLGTFSDNNGNNEIG